MSTIVRPLQLNCLSWRGAGETAQWAMHLVQEHEDLCLNPGIHIKSEVGVAAHVIMSCALNPSTVAL